MIDVFHADNAAFLMINREFLRGDKLREYVSEFFTSHYHQVATVDTDDLDVAFQDTNSIDSHWHTNTSIKWFLSDQSRSTSVGDVLAHDGKLYLVDAIGFKEVTLG